jgi:antirestriction protein ArdC
MTLTTSATTTEQQHEQPQNQEPAQASSNARGEKEKIDIYTEVTNQLLELMETAQTSGQSMWANVLAGLPHNQTTSAPYRGINTIILWARAIKSGFSSSAWMTYKQAEAKGWKIKKGSKATRIIYYKTCESKTAIDAEGEALKYAMLKTFAVFNLNDITDENGEAVSVSGLPTPVWTSEGLTAIEGLATRNNVNINFGGNAAFYSPRADAIQLPSKSQFSSAAHFDHVLAHEMTHWTGHKSRLDRFKSKRHENAEYAFEELIAELGSAFLMAQTGGAHVSLENHACYLQSWIKALQNDNKFIFKAAAEASRAAAFILTKELTKECLNECLLDS